ncbi:MAG: methyltransferase, TIGR04325 family [Flavobacteriales bacterium]|nr:MAG: methyltransferase, TIGR04325 family [Flavobacteriales bacterium]
MKTILKKIVPPLFIDGLKLMKREQYGWFGDFQNWIDAEKESTGYNQTEILEKVKSSLLKVKNGEAVYERDSVVFDEVEYFWTLLSTLMFVAAKSKGHLNLLDFGGSLGSTYYQNKKFLDELSKVSWGIVEQKHFVEIGKESFENDVLVFHDNITACKKAKNPNVILLSGVIQYLEEPYKMLENIIAQDFEFIIFDLTPFTVSDNDRITIQKVSPEIYEANYPCWLLSYSKFMESLLKKYEVIEEFQSMKDFKISIKNKFVADYRGALLKRKNND